MSSRGSATRSGRHSGARRLPRRAACCLGCLAVAALVLLATGPPAGAQEFGQWSWDAALGARQVGQQSELDGEPIGSRDETSLNLALGVRGFILHPALARFRVGADVALSKFDGTRSRDNHIWGFDANLEGLPRGAYPFSVYARRRAFSYEDLQEEDPLNLLGVPEASTAFGGRLRFRRGLLSGTQLGFDQQGISYSDAGSRSTRDQRAFVDWSRSSGRFQHHFRLRRRAQDFRVTGFGTRDLTANYDQRGYINPAWRWDMFVIGLRRDLDSPARPASRFDNLRTQQLLVHTLSGQNRVELSYNGGLVRTAGGPAGHSHLFVSRYRWWVRTGWELAPFVSYAFQTRDGLTVHAPQAGVFTTWSGRAGPLDTLLSGGLGYTRFRRSVEALSGGDSTLTMEVTGTFGHGRDDALRTELEASWGRNQLRLIGEAMPELPDLGLSLTGLGTEDSARGRLTLRRLQRGKPPRHFPDVHRPALYIRPAHPYAAGHGEPAHAHRQPRPRPRGGGGPPDDRQLVGVGILASPPPPVAERLVPVRLTPPCPGPRHRRRAFRGPRRRVGGRLPAARPAVRDRPA
jgi:hypothetical protein